MIGGKMSRKLLIAALLIAATGCSNYDLTVNEKVVYTPRPLLADVTIADENLKHCVEQAIADQQVTRPNELTSLTCNGAGVSSVAGLDVFTGLRELALASNQISDLSPLTPLSSLQRLDLSDNQIEDAVPLYQLLSLGTLDLSGNPRLKCPGSSALFQLAELTLPVHCPKR